MTLDGVNAEWERLAQADPFWAVATHDRYHGGRHLDGFYATGKSDVKQIMSLLRPLDDPPSLSMQSHVLDFGCGVGRLSFALAGWFGSVVGVDASISMIDRAEQQSWADWHHGEAEVRFVHSTTQAIPFGDGEFDLAVSLLVLQHLPRPSALAYLVELCRVVRPGGWLAVQLPTRPTGRPNPVGTGGAPLPHPDGGPAGRMAMNGIPAEVVASVLPSARASLIATRPDGRCGPAWESHLYLIRKWEGEVPWAVGP